MREILIKAYGWLEIPATKAQSDCQCKAHCESQGDFQNDNLEDCLSALHALCREWYLEENIFSLEGNLLQISHEGDYFPHKDVAMVLAKYVSQTSKGKLDYIDLEAWTLQRYFLDAEHNSLLLSQLLSQSPSQSLLQSETENITATPTEKRTHKLTSNSTKKSTDESTGKKELLPYSRKSSLNHALEAAQEKNNKMFMP